MADENFWRSFVEAVCQILLFGRTTGWCKGSWYLSVRGNNHCRESSTLLVTILIRSRGYDGEGFFELCFVAAG
jgi:hypothetical protein